MPLKVISTNSIAVAAGKGGVGKSTFTVLLAGALKRRGEKVGIVDADLYGPSIRHLLPEQRLPKEANGKWIPARAQGIQTISLAYFRTEATIRAPIANQLLTQFLQNVVWDGISWLLVDFPPGTGDIPLTAAQTAALTGAVIVTTPQKIALLDVRKTVAMFQKMHVPILGIVENMSGSVFGEGGGLALSEEFGVPFLGAIPLDPAVRKAADCGMLLTIDYVDAMIEKLGEAGSDPVKEITLLGEQARLVWEDGLTSLLTAEALQKRCPCAQCREGNTVHKNVTFLNHERMGRYGLRFDFSSGCSYGIYDFALIKRCVCEEW